MKFLFTAAAACAVDTAIKEYIEKQPEDYRKELLGGRVVLRKSHNQGAMLNLMEKRQELVAGFSLGLTAALTCLWAALPADKSFRGLKGGLSLLLAGAYSNVLDRVRRGYVVDYFSLNVGGRLKKVVFNLGDLFIFLGSFLTAVTARSFRRQ